MRPRVRIPPGPFRCLCMPIIRPIKRPLPVNALLQRGQLHQKTSTAMKQFLQLGQYAEEIGVVPRNTYTRELVEEQYRKHPSLLGLAASHLMTAILEREISHTLQYSTHWSGIWQTDFKYNAETANTFAKIVSEAGYSFEDMPNILDEILKHDLPSTTNKIKARKI